MEAAGLVATLHCSGCTLFLSTEITVLVYVGRTQGRGNYSIMVHGEFCWLGGDQEFITTNLTGSFNKEGENCVLVPADAEMCNRLCCLDESKLSEGMQLFWIYFT